MRFLLSYQAVRVKRGKIKASTAFLLRFKRKDRFTSRKFTQFVTRVEKENEQKIQEEPAKFVRDVNIFRQNNY